MPAVRRTARTDRPLLPATQRIHPLSVSLDLLRDGELEIVGRLTDASNATFLCRVSLPGAIDPDEWPADPSSGADGQDEEAPLPPLCIYKPIRGERPLDDFPDGTLARREMAAYVASEATGWGIVPPTLLRDGPFGAGMVQAFVEADPASDPVELVTSADPRLRPICLFDALVNNADRKGSHLLPLPDGTILGVDHGICFAVEPKLRTVLWAWRGERLTDGELTVLRAVSTALDDQLGAELGELLAPAEVDATRRRAQQLLVSGRFPQPDPLRPAVPWPPF